MFYSIQPNYTLVARRVSLHDAGAEVEAAKLQEFRVSTGQVTRDSCHVTRGPPPPLDSGRERADVIREHHFRPRTEETD